MIVMKFGGTSLGDPSAIRKCAEIVERHLARKPLVVVSAHSKVTDMLLNAARAAVKGDVEGPFERIRKRHYDILDGLGLPHETIEKNMKELGDLLRGISMVKEVTPRTLDYAASFGERMSSKAFAAYMRKRGHATAEAINAYDLGLVTDSRFTNARPLPESYDRIPRAFEPHREKLVILTGFIAKDKNGDITTIGRSGSDYTAAIFGAALGAEEIQVWKDVLGILTADPTIVPEARPIERMSFAEASELAYYGAEVLHPSTIIPAVKAGIPIRVLHTFDPDAPGTVICDRCEPNGAHPVKSIVYKEDQILVNITSTRMLMAEGFMAKIFNVFERHHIVIDMISTSEVSVSLTTDSDEGLDAACEELREFATVDVERGKAIFAVVGEGMRNTIGMAARTFAAVAEAGVNIRMISQGASEINIAFLVDNKDIPATVKSLHRRFFGV
ncbi:MAG: aspartate kinase [Planctomycetota bacterium]|nr:aspartate kinase [Planctomycetota bacterium]